jgi:cytochrome P450
MRLYPHVMKKAQAEIDAVVGRDRLPMFEDQNDLPYVRAIVKEVLRWRPVAPLAMPRRAIKVLSADSPSVGVRPKKSCLG